MPSTGITKSSASPRGHHQAHIACSREESRPRGRALERHVRKGAHDRIVAASFELVDVLACNPGRLRELCSFRRRHRGLPTYCFRYPFASIHASWMWSRRPTSLQPGLGSAELDGYAPTKVLSGAIGA